MPRDRRILQAGAVYHVYSRGVLKSLVFIDDEDRQQFLMLLIRYATKFGVEIRAYCLMSNHFHLHVRTLHPNLSAFMHSLLSAYARGFNARHQRRGHVFESRYGSPIVEPGWFEVRLSRYVHRNPVKAGLVESPGDYEWSSYSDYVATSGRHWWIQAEDVLEHVVPRGGDRCESYRAYAEAADDDPSDIAQSFELRAALGGEEFRGPYERQETRRARPVVLPHLRTPADLEETFAAVSSAFECPRLLVENGAGKDKSARMAAALLLYEVVSMKQADIGRRLGNVSARTVARYRSRAVQAFANEPVFRVCFLGCLSELGRDVPPLLQDRG